jgi:hypothetical protein
VRTLPPKLAVSTTLSKIWLSVGPFFHGFAHNSLVSRPFLTRKVSDRSSQCAPRIGQGVVSSIQLLVWSMVRSNLGQPWSNLVKTLRTLGNGSWTAFRGFLAIAGLSRVRNGPVKPWSNLVKLREMCPRSSS